MKVFVWYCISDPFLVHEITCFVFDPASILMVFSFCDLSVIAMGLEQGGRVERLTYGVILTRNQSWWLLSSWSSEGRIKAVQSKQVRQLAWKGKRIIWGICKFQKVFGFSNLYNFFLGSTHIDVGVIMLGVLTPGGFSKCLFITIFRVGVDLIRSYQFKCFQRPDRSRKCVR